MRIYIQLVAIAALCAVALGVPTVTTTYGVMAGITVPIDSNANAVNAFLGVPFAQPPIQSLRFMPPLNRTKWEGVYQATSFKSICPQYLAENTTIIPISLDEDCLYINMWVPATATPTSKLPVVIFFPGTYQYFDPTIDGELNGARLAYSQNVVFITVQYRINVFGFPGFSFASPSSDVILNNLGLQDQLMAMRFVQENIAAFGGNPKHVTIQGQASGAVSVCAHLVSQASVGLFHQAVMESLGCHRNPLPWDTQNQYVAEFCGITGPNLPDCAMSDLACLQRLDVATLLQASSQVDFDIIIDGFFVPGQPQNLITTGKWNKVPLLIGSTLEEGYPKFAEGTLPNTPVAYYQWLFGTFWQTADLIQKEYPLATYNGSVNAAVSAIFGDVTINCPTRRLATLAIQCYWIPGAACSPVYYYQFVVAPQWGPGSYYGSYAPEIPNIYGAYHGGDLPFVFYNERLNSVERNFSALLQNYFGSFYRTGNPNFPGGPHWPIFTENTGVGGQPWQYLTLDYNPVTGRDAAFVAYHHCDFWDNLGPPLWTYVAVLAFPVACFIGVIVLVCCLCRSRAFPTILRPRPDHKYAVSIHS